MQTVYHNEVFIPENEIIKNKGALPQSQAITASRFTPSNKHLKNDYDESVKEFFNIEYPGVTFPDFNEITTLSVTLEDYDGESYIYSHMFTF